jgi:GTPase SAR1 family protein
MQCSQTTFSGTIIAEIAIVAKFMNDYQEDFLNRLQRSEMQNTFSASFEHYQQQRSRLLSLTERLLTLAKTQHSPALFRELQLTRDLLSTYTLKILVAGELNAGKSTIINALLRTKILPAYPVPTTVLVTRVKQGAQPEALLHRRPSRDGRRLPPLRVTLAEIEPYLVFNEDDDQTDNFEEAEVLLPLPPIYDDIEFIDVIGPYDDDGYGEAIEHYIPSADVALYALRCDAPASQDEALYIDWISNIGEAALLILCNRFDLVEPRSQSRIRQNHLAYLGQLSGVDSLFFTNAKGALEGYLRGDTRQVAQSAMPQMEEALYAILDARGKQNLQSIIAELRSLLRLSQQILLLRIKFQQSTPQTREDSLAQLHHECEWIEKEQRRVDHTFNALRRRVAEETKSAAANFYRECSNTLDNLAQGFILQQPRTAWEIFSGDASERLAKQVITFLTHEMQNQLQAWISPNLAALLQDEIKSGGIGLTRDAPELIVQAVMRRVNRVWHPMILIKALIADARLNISLAPDLEQVRASVVNLFRRSLATSTDRLVETITGALEDELHQRQQALAHRLDLQFRCLHDVARTHVTEEQGQRESHASNVLPLLTALEDELAAIEQEVGNF